MMYVETIELMHLQMRDIPAVDPSLISKTGDHRGHRSMKGSTLVYLGLPINHLRQPPLEVSMVLTPIATRPLPIQGQINTNRTARTRSRCYQKDIAPMNKTGQIFHVPDLINPQRHIKATSHLTDIVHRQGKMNALDRWDRLVVDHRRSIEQDPRCHLRLLHQIRMRYHRILFQSDPVYCKALP